MSKFDYFERHSSNFERLKNITSVKDPVSGDLIPLMREYESAIDFYNKLLDESFDDEVFNYLKLSRIALAQLGRLVKASESPDFSKGFIRLRSFEGGLANRLRAFCSALVMSNIFDSTLEVSWLPDQHCEMNFERMFLNGLSTLVEEKVPSNYIESILVYDDHCIEIIDNPDPWILWDKYCKSRLAWVDFYELYKITLNNIFNKHLNQDILLRAKMLLEANSMGDAVGLHIRSTDFLRHYELRYPGRRLAKVVDFISVLNEKKIYKVFLATDSANVEQEFTKKYAGQVIRLEHDFYIDKFRQTSVDSAFCDIYALSKCKNLIATFGSSFSGMASDLSGIDIQYI